MNKVITGLVATFAVFAIGNSIVDNNASEVLAGMVLFLLAWIVSK